MFLLADFLSEEVLFSFVASLRPSHPKLVTNFLLLIFTDVDS